MLTLAARVVSVSIVSWFSLSPAPQISDLKKMLEHLVVLEIEIYIISLGMN